MEESQISEMEQEQVCIVVVAPEQYYMLVIPPECMGEAPPEQVLGVAGRLPLVLEHCRFGVVVALPP